MAQITSKTGALLIARATECEAIADALYAAGLPGVGDAVHKAARILAESGNHIVQSAERYSAYEHEES